MDFELSEDAKLNFEKIIIQWPISLKFGTAIIQEDGSTSCYCKFRGCGRVFYNYDKKQRGFESHLKSHNIQNSRTNIPKLLEPFGLTVTIPPKLIVTYDIYVNKVIDFVIQTKQPFSIVDHPSFRDLLDLCQAAEDPKIIRHFGRKKLTKEVSSRAKSEKEDMINILANQPSVSLALDTWKSTNNHVILIITVHFAGERWRLNELILALRKPKGGQHGQNLARLVIEVLLEYKLQTKVFTVTTDAAKSMSTLCEHLYQGLKHYEGNEYTYPDNHLFCFTHQLNTITQTIMRKGFASKPLKVKEYRNMIASSKKSDPIVETSPKSQVILYKIYYNTYI